jgi:hypothetical protein
MGLLYYICDVFLMNDNGKWSKTKLYILFTLDNTCSYQKFNIAFKSRDDIQNTILTLYQSFKLLHAIEYN